MNRKFSIRIPFIFVGVVSLLNSIFSTAAWSQLEVNVVSFLETVGKVCGGTIQEEISSEGDNISFKSAEVTVNPGTGRLLVRKDGVILAKFSGEQSDAYYSCVKDLTKTLGGAFTNSNKSDNNSVNIPVFSGLISDFGFMNETDDFIHFLDENRLSVVFIRLFVDQRLHVPVDYAANEIDFCEANSKSVFEGTGSRLQMKTASNDSRLSRVSNDYEQWIGLSEDERQSRLYEAFDRFEDCSTFSLKIETNRAKQWDDNGLEVMGFFLVDDTGGHMTRPLITLEERNANSVEWQFARSALPAAEKAREQRIEAFWQAVE